VEGHPPDEVAKRLAAEQIAVWAGDSYAVSAVEHLGLADRGGVVRAGVVRYVSGDDVARLLDAVGRIARGR
jgi:selenocysteine lyase/cysteine desulfurase